MSGARELGSLREHAWGEVLEGGKKLEREVSKKKSKYIYLRELRSLSFEKVSEARAKRWLGL